jgi:hypothetical protein
MPAIETPLRPVVGWVLISVTPLRRDQAGGIAGQARVRAAYYTGARLPTRTITKVIDVDEVDTWDPEAAWRAL